MDAHVNPVNYGNSGKRHIVFGRLGVGVYKGTCKAPSGPRHSQTSLILNNFILLSCKDVSPCSLRVHLHRHHSDWHQHCMFLRPHHNDIQELTHTFTFYRAGTSLKPHTPSTFSPHTSRSILPLLRVPTLPSMRTVSRYYIFNLSVQTSKRLTDLNSFSQMTNLSNSSRTRLSSPSSRLPRNSAM